MRIYKAEILEGQPFIPIARVTNTAGAYITQAAVSSISYAVANAATLVSTGTGSLVVADVVFDTLQTGANWNVDGTGYNFLATIPATCFPDGNVIYRVEVSFVPTSGTAIVLAYDCTTLDLIST